MIKMRIKKRFFTISMFCMLFLTGCSFNVIGRIRMGFYDISKYQTGRVELQTPADKNSQSRLLCYYTRDKNELFIDLQDEKYMYYILNNEGIGVYVKESENDEGYYTTLISSIGKKSKIDINDYKVNEYYSDNINRVELIREIDTKKIIKDIFDEDLIGTDILSKLDDAPNLKLKYVYLNKRINQIEISITEFVNHFLSDDYKEEEMKIIIYISDYGNKNVTLRPLKAYECIEISEEQYYEKARSQLNALK